MSMLFSPYKVKNIKLSYCNVSYVYVRSERKNGMVSEFHKIH